MHGRRLQEHGDGNVVRCGTGDDKHMPSAMRPRPTLILNKEEDTRTVQKTSSDQPNHFAMAQCMVERSDCNEDEPAHGKIKQQLLVAFITFPVERIEQEADSGKPPDDAQQAPAPSALQGKQTKGGIASGYHQIDGDMIQFLPAVVFGPMGKAMMKA